MYVHLKSPYQAKGLHQNIYLSFLIQHIQAYLFEGLVENRRSYLQNINYHHCIATYEGQPIITLCISIMDSFKQNRSLSFFSVTENSKKIPVNGTNQWACCQKITNIGQTWKRL